MLDRLIDWGQSYGLYTTIALLLWLYFSEYLKNNRLNKALETARKEKEQYASMYDALVGTSIEEDGKLHDNVG